MVKKNNQSEKSKPKFQQTTLCFSTPIKKDSKPYLDLEKSIRSLNIRKLSDHPDPCQNCDVSIPRIQCTAISCKTSYCLKCIEDKLNETEESIKDNSVEYMHPNGNLIQHRSNSEYNWACIICRNLCDCKYCKDSTPSKKTKPPILSFNTKPAPIPTFEPIQLLHPVKDLWLRLQIREFLFRFGPTFGFQGRYLNHLQHVQGDWKMKRLTAHIVWHVLTTLKRPSFDPPDLSRRARHILQAWTKESGPGLFDQLCLEGLSTRRRQDLESLLDHQPIQHELEFLNELLQLLLSDVRHLLGSIKEPKQSLPDPPSRLRQQHLLSRVQQLKMIRGKEAELAEAELELDRVQTEVRDQLIQTERLKLEYEVRLARSSKRLVRAGLDGLGNEYWLFSDVLDHLAYAVDYRNLEPFWAYGVVVIGPGLDGQESRWWSCHGKKNLQVLIEFLQHDHPKISVELVQKLKQRIEYLKSLEWAVYGEGFFS